MESYSCDKEVERTLLKEQIRYDAVNLERMVLSELAEAEKLLCVLEQHSRTTSSEDADILAVSVSTSSGGP